MDYLDKEVEAKTRQELADLARKHIESMFKIEVEVLEDGTLPAKAHKTDAGFDLYATADVTIFPGQIVKHPLNIRMRLPSGTWARVETKSGLGSKGQFVYAGVIDETYRGIPHAIMTNLNWQTVPYVDEHGEANVMMNPLPLVIKKGEKLAQLTMNPHSNNFFIVQVEKVDTNTERGEGGFGSTGK